MAREDLAPHIREITRALKDPVSEAELLRELTEYLEVYRLTLPAAKRSLVKKHGGDPSKLASASTAQSRTIADLLGGEGNVDVTGKILSVRPKDVEARGERRTILTGLLGDSTGTVRYTIWEPGELQLEPGMLVQFRHAYTKEWNQRVDLHLGSRGLLERIEGDPSAFTPPAGPVTRVKIGDLREKGGFVDVTARILSASKRSVEVRGARRELVSGLLADETGKIPFTAWHNFDLKVDEVVRISGATVRSWRGAPELAFDERATVTRTMDRLPSAEELGAAARTPIHKVAQSGGAIDVVISGTVLEVKEGSGLVMRCPQCNRVLQKGTCRIHGKLEGTPDLRIKATIDDGTGALTAVLNQSLSEQLLGLTIDRAMERAREAMNLEVVRDQMADALLGRPLQLRGNAKADEYGLMLIAREASFVSTDIRSATEALLERLEEETGGEE